MREAVPIIGDRRRAVTGWPLKAWASVIVLGVGTALILAVLLVIASRLGSIQSVQREEVASRTEEARSRLERETARLDADRARHEEEMQQLHRLEVAINTQAAWYQEDVRLHLLKEKH